MFSFSSIPGERERKRGGGVTWSLLVAIPHPPDIYLPSPGMMGVLDVAGRQERFSAKTYTTQKCLYWKNNFSEASPIIWLNYSYVGPVICGVRVAYFVGTTRIASQSNIVTESPTSSIRYTSRSSTHKETRCKATTTFYNYFLRTSVVSSTNFRSILIFASCVVVTRNILNG